MKTVTLPEGFDPIAYAAGPGRSIAVISSSPPSLAVFGDSAEYLILLDSVSRPVGLRFVPHTKTVEVLDSETATTTRYSGDARITQPALEPPFNIDKAVAGPNGWFVSGFTEGTLELYWLTEGIWKYLSAIRLNDGNPVQYHLTVDGGRLLVSWSRPDLGILIIDTAGSVVAARSPETQLPRRIARDTKVHAFPAVMVGSRIVQTIANLRDDKFMVILHDSVGNVLRSMETPVALAFVGGTPSRNSVIATSNLTGVTHLMFYETGIARGR